MSLCIKYWPLHDSVLQSSMNVVLGVDVFYLGIHSKMHPTLSTIYVVGSVNDACDFYH